jgi:hypothetical protein
VKLTLIPLKKEEEKKLKAKEISFNLSKDLCEMKEFSSFSHVNEAQNYGKKSSAAAEVGSLERKIS